MDSVFKKTIELSKTMERVSAVRSLELGFGHKFKKKNKTYLIKDAALKTVIKQYRRNRISQKQYLKKITYLMGDYRI